MSSDEETNNSITESVTSGDHKSSFPNLLKNMEAALAPHETFAKADAFLLEAKDAQNKSATMIDEAQALRIKAASLTQTAFDLQRLAAHDRIQISDEFDKILQHYTDVLEDYNKNEKDAEALHNLNLAIEEGRAMPEEVHLINARLGTFRKKLDSHSLVTDEVPVSGDAKQSSKRRRSSTSSAEPENLRDLWSKPKKQKRNKSDEEDLPYRAENVSVMSSSSDDSMEVQIKKNNRKTFSIPITGKNIVEATPSVQSEDESTDSHTPGKQLYFAEGSQSPVTRDESRDPAQPQQEPQHQISNKNKYAGDGTQPKAKPDVPGQDDIDTQSAPTRQGEKSKKRKKRKRNGGGYNSNRQVENEISMEHGDHDAKRRASLNAQKAKHFRF